MYTWKVDVIVTTTASDRAASNQVHRCKQVRRGRKLACTLSLSLQLPCVVVVGLSFSWGAKNRQKVTQFSEMGKFCRKWPSLKRKQNLGCHQFMPTVPSIHPDADFDVRPLVFSRQTRNQCRLHQGMEKEKNTGSVSVWHGAELGGLIMLSTLN
jgi:hypothetical protein